MADDQTNETNESNLVPMTPEQLKVIEQAEKDMTLSFSGDVVVLQDIATQLGIPAQTVKLKDIEGMEITIHSVRPVASAYEGSPFFLFATFTTGKDDTLYGVALGGGVIIEKIRRYATSGVGASLRCTPIYIEGGRHSGYWDLK